MKMSFVMNDIELSASDFPRTLQGWVAFSIAMSHATKCRDKKSALELLLSDAEEIIRKVQEGSVP